MAAWHLTIQRRFIDMNLTSMNLTSSDNFLSLLAGQWTGKETIASSKWGAGGTAVSIVSSRLDFNGHALIQDYRAERDGKIWLTAHAIFVFDESNASCNLFWFDSLGFVPTQPAPGVRDGNTCNFVRTSPRGQTRHTYSFPEDNKYHLLLESSFDGGATWVQIMDGTYSRTS